MVHKSLHDVPADQAFWLHRGIYIHNIVQLRDVLVSMEAAEFSFYVNSLKNDFANWIEHVVGDRVLVKEFRSTDTQEGLVASLHNRIVGLERRYVPVKKASSKKTVKTSSRQRLLDASSLPEQQTLPESSPLPSSLVHFFHEAEGVQAIPHKRATVYSSQDILTYMKKVYRR